jgi:hypothetical protein
MRLDAFAVVRAAQANWRSAERFTRRAEEFIEERARRAALR